jgi:hypothetical protein
MTNTIYILSIDGGGIRGIIPTRILQNIENDPVINKNKEKTFIYNKFDAFSGSSSGAMLVGGITYHRSSITNILDNYINQENFNKMMPPNYKYIGIVFLSSVILTVFIVLGYFILPRIICDKSYVSLIGAIIGFLISIILITISSILILYSFPEYPAKGKTEVIENFIGNHTKFSNDNNKNILITSYNMDS